MWGEGPLRQQMHKGPPGLPERAVARTPGLQGFFSGAETVVERIKDNGTEPPVRGQNTEPTSRALWIVLFQETDCLVGSTHLRSVVYIGGAGGAFLRLRLRTFSTLFVL